MWPFKSKFQKLKRGEVVDSICELEKREAAIEEGLIDRENEIQKLMEKGRLEKSRDTKIFYAKKIASLREEKQTDIKRGVYLLYNIKLMKRLKDAIDDNEFIVQTGKVSMRSLLSDQKGLAKFLNQALQLKVKDEEMLTSADETFTEVKDAYIENETIYGVQSNDDELLAMFETGEQLDVEIGESEKTATRKVGISGADE